MKKTLLILLMISAILSFGAAKRVAYVINGSLGDQSFYDSGHAGIVQLEKEFGVEARVLECNFDPSLYYPSLMTAARWADVIFVISYGFEEELKEIASMFPNKIWVNIDTVVQDENGIISSVDFREEEGAFMAGVVAAIVTESDLPGTNPEKIIGAVGGDDDIVIRAFMYGYEQGAHFIDPEVEVKVVYAGTWDDPAKGKQAALQLYSQGADIVFQVAALTGSGVLQAAEEVGKYAIGVDSNQNGLAPGHVVTSDLKEVGKSIYSIYKMIVDGTFEKGKVYSFGVKEGMVGLAIDEYTHQILTEEMISRIVEIQEKVASGEVTVQTYTPQE